ncbi:response regulator transcription factor [Glutamicibacter ardleyensis]|uniref:response regulator transcription factor n=2 Tax=Glutamicibacter ardleyensis TaxID=225894 RepID=UPI003FB97361
MNASPRALPQKLPSRQHAYQEAHASVLQGAPVFIVGQFGSGRTTFAHQTLSNHPGKSYWITAAKALQEVPFALLSTLTAQLPTQTSNFTPAEMISELVQYTANQGLYLFLDQAEHADEQSAAVFSQLSLTGNIHLVVATSAIKHLPQSLKDLRTSARATRIELTRLTFADAEVILEDVFGGQVNSSTIGTLLELSDGNALHLHELTLDAQKAKVLTKQGCYWTLDRSWNPQGPRISDLIASRLHAQPPSIREAIELLAVTGRLKYPFAQQLLGSTLPQVLESRLAKLVTLWQDETTGERELAVVLSSGLAPQTVLNTLTQAQLRDYLRRASDTFPRDVLTSNSRAWFTRHRLMLGIAIPAQELFDDVVTSAQARRFAQVVALTDALDRESFTDQGMLEHVLVLRADALYELGKPEVALSVLQPMLQTGSAQLRGVAAKIAFAGLGRPDLATQIIDSEPNDPVESHAYRLLLLSRAQQVVDTVKLREYAADQSISPELRAACLAHVLIEDCYAGRPVSAFEELAGHIADKSWSLATPATQAELFFALPVLSSSLGGVSPEFGALLAGIDFAELAINHANYLTAHGLELLEQGVALGALEAFEQALALASYSDPYLLTGFAASFAACAAVLVGDLPKARMHYSVVQSSPAMAGQIMRPFADRALLPVLLELEGQQAAEDHLAHCLAHAEKFGRRLSRLRLLHDAWRLGLSVEVDELSEAAALVQGPLAQALAQYASVIEAPSQSAVEGLVSAHVASQRLLYAAEVAHRASVVARDLGQRTLASRLLALATETAVPLEQVNTPSLGRGRIIRSLLTEREHATCVLAARGASNQEIAEELFLSPRTVEGHLQRSYTKLGIATRRQLLPSSVREPVLEENLEELSEALPVSRQSAT